MTKPKKAAPPPSTASSYLLLAVKVLLVVVIILLLPKLVTGAKSRGGGKRNKKFVKQFEAIKYDCEQSASCKKLLPEESSMCVSQCVSESCHEQVYGTNSLEDGEIDILRAREFQKCVKDEIRAQNAKDRASSRAS